MEDRLLTTIDNPYNPFTDFDNWYSWDISHGYHTCSYLARLSNTSYELSDVDNDLAIDEAQNEIVRNDPLGKYIIVTKATANKVLESNLVEVL